MRERERERDIQYEMYVMRERERDIQYEMYVMREREREGYTV